MVSIKAYSIVLYISKLPSLSCVLKQKKYTLRAHVIDDGELIWSINYVYRGLFLLPMSPSMEESQWFCTHEAENNFEGLFEERLAKWQEMFFLNKGIYL